MTTPETPQSAINGADFRRVLGHYPTGVCVVTAKEEGQAPVGMVVGSFTSVSLDPPLVAFFPDRKSRSWSQIQAAGRFRVNVLGTHQEALCRQFARSEGDKFSDVEWSLSEQGTPALHDVVAWIECELDAVHEAGDHFIAIGRVIALDVVSREPPLLFFQGGYGGFSPMAMISGAP